MKPRKTPDRDSRYMALAWVMASFSKDPSTQVGACIVDPKANRPLGWGYNGPPAAMDDDNVEWKRPDKYNYVLHAEENAIEHSSGKLKGMHIYVTHKPCRKCMLRIAQKKISKVIYTNVKPNKGSSLHQNEEEMKVVQKIAKDCEIEMEEYKGSIGWLQDWVMEMKEIGLFGVL